MNIKTIYKSLLLDIQNQKYLPGDLLPTENELATQFNTTRMNAHRAVKELELLFHPSRKIQYARLLQIDSVSTANQPIWAYFPQKV